MGTLFVLVSPCFRENVVVTCKIGSFLCSLDNLLQKNVIVFFFGNQISIWRSFEKRAILTYFSHFLVTREVTKIPTAHISLTYKHVFCSPYWLILLYQFWKKKPEFIRYGFSLVWFLVLILIRAILDQSINNKMVAKFKLECLLLMCIYTIVRFFFHFCQFIISFRSLHSFWKEEDLSREINTSFTEWHIIILWLFSFRIIQSMVQWHTFKTSMFVFIFSCSLQNFTRYSIIKYLINVKPITSSHKIQAKTFTWPNMSFYAR